MSWLAFCQTCDFVETVWSMGGNYQCTSCGGLRQFWSSTDEEFVPSEHFRSELRAGTFQGRTRSLTIPGQQQTWGPVPWNWANGRHPGTVSDDVRLLDQLHYRFYRGDHRSSELGVRTLLVYDEVFRERGAQIPERHRERLRNAQAGIEDTLRDEENASDTDGPLVRHLNTAIVRSNRRQQVAQHGTREILIEITAQSMAALAQENVSQTLILEEPQQSEEILFSMAHGIMVVTQRMLYGAIEILATLSEDVSSDEESDKARD